MKLSRQLTQAPIGGLPKGTSIHFNATSFRFDQAVHKNMRTTPRGSVTGIFSFKYRERTEPKIIFENRLMALRNYVHRDEWKIEDAHHTINKHYYSKRQQRFPIKDREVQRYEFFPTSFIYPIHPSPSDIKRFKPENNPWLNYKRDPTVRDSHPSNYVKFIVSEDLNELEVAEYLHSIYNLKDGSGFDILSIELENVDEHNVTKMDPDFSVYSTTLRSPDKIFKTIEDIAYNDRIKIAHVMIDGQFDYPDLASVSKWNKKAAKAGKNDGLASIENLNNESAKHSFEMMKSTLDSLKNELSGKDFQTALEYFESKYQNFFQTCEFYGEDQKIGTILSHLENSTSLMEKMPYNKPITNKTAALVHGSDPMTKNLRVVQTFMGLSNFQLYAMLMTELLVQVSLSFKMQVLRSEKEANSSLQSYQPDEEKLNLKEDYISDKISGPLNSVKNQTLLRGAVAVGSVLPVVGKKYEKTEVSLKLMMNDVMTGENLMELVFSNVPDFSKIDDHEYAAREILKTEKDNKKIQAATQVLQVCKDMKQQINQFRKYKDFTKTNLARPITVRDIEPLKTVILDLLKEIDNLDYSKIKDFGLNDHIVKIKKTASKIEEEPNKNLDFYIRELGKSYGQNMNVKERVLNQEMQDKLNKQFAERNRRRAEEQFRRISRY